MEVISEVERISNKNKEILKNSVTVDYSMFEGYQQYDYHYDINKILYCLDLDGDRFKPHFNAECALDKKFTCHTCKYATNKFFNLKRHFLIHTGGERQHCDVCDYFCTGTDKLRKHKLTHRDEKLFVCSYCKYACKEHENLREHILGHVGKKIYSCSDCSYLSSRANNLKRHRMKHSGLKPYVSNLCENKSSAVDVLTKQTKNSGNRNYVKRIVRSGEKVTREKQKKEILSTVKLFSCSDCSYSSSRTNNLKRHRKTHTNPKFKVCYS